MVNLIELPINVIEAAEETPFLADYFIRRHNKYYIYVKLIIIQIFNKPSCYK